MKLHRPRTYYRMFKRAFQGPAFLHEPEVMKVFKKLNGNLFIDVGCNLGLYSIPLSRRFKEVWAIDPNYSAILRMEKEAVKLHRNNIKTFVLAISNQIGNAPFFIDDSIGKCNGLADTLLPEFNYRPASRPDIDKSTWNQESVTVSTSTLDRLLSFYQVEADLVKIDVEGAEFLVLEGMEKSLSGGKAKNLMIELHDRERKYELQKFVAEFNLYSRWVDLDHLFCSLKKMS